MDLYLYEYDANTAVRAESLSRAVLEVKTCQRTFLLAWSPLSAGTPRRFFQGVEAYDFLLRFACGLESEIKGETDVFGQLRTSIKTFTESRPELTPDQVSLFSKLFEDTKEVRAQYLQGIGGNTYGALARRVLEPSPSSRVLILGAGQISKSVAPYFADAFLSIYNRSEERLMELKADLLKKGYSKFHFSSDLEFMRAGIREADLILIATPAGSAVDEEVIAGISGKTGELRPRVLHLGAQNKEVRHFFDAGIPVLTLSDLFALEKEQHSFRERQIAQAMEACRNRSILRSLARSIHIPHGWEDLALFY